MNREPAVSNPAHGAVGTHDSVFLVVLARLHPDERSEHAFPVFGMERSRPVLERVVDVPHWPPPDRFERRADVERRLRHVVGKPEHLTDVFRELPEAQLAFRERLLVADPPGDVAQEHREQAALTQHHLRERRLQREWLTVRAPAPHHEAAGCAVAGGILEIARDVGRVLGASVFRDEHGHGLTAQLALCRAEHLLGSGIQHHDPLLLVHGHDAVHGGLDDALEPALALVDGGLCTPARRDVVRVGEAGPVAEARSANAHPDRGTRARGDPVLTGHVPVGPEP